MNQKDAEKLAKFKEILTEDYVKELLELETPADVQESLRGKGVELSEEELESVAGGVAGALLLAGIATCAAAVFGIVLCTVFLRTRW